MKRFKKCMSAITAAALILTALPANSLTTAYAVETGSAGNTVAAVSPTDVTVKLDPSDRSTFHDTDGDGLGEFEGWGTSLCWWANRLGYDQTLTQAAARDFFSSEGLNMNIGRYNVGGGDDVVPPQAPITVNPKAQIYDLETEGNPTYEGSEMSVTESTEVSSAQYTISDADFGITKGTTVGKQKAIGYIDKLDGTDSRGDELHYAVTAEEPGDYTVKLLMMHNANTDRDVAIRVGGADGAEYVVDNEGVQNSKASTGDNKCLFLITIDDVALAAGRNDLEVAGKNDWTLDFIKMLIVKTSEKGVLPEEPDLTGFKHLAHITRSDSAVPGYCVDVTEIEEGGDYTEFDRVDVECGYAWNYDWDADKNQINILKAAIEANEANGADYIAEAFSNSPPYFMTVSGCSSGGVDASENLREDSYNAFAAYMADVIVHWTEEGIKFQSVSPMNEPDPSTKYWGANSNKQEGCHIAPGTSQSNIITALAKELKRQAEAATEPGVKEALNNIIYSASDETSIDLAIDNYNSLTKDAKEVVTRIDTHAYGGSKREELRSLAENSNENLWMSEVDGAYTAGTNAGEMSAALGLAGQIMKDLNGMKASAWILWNAVDAHADQEDKVNWPDSANDFATMDDLYEKNDVNKGYWGIAFGDHNDKQLVLTQKYYAFGQFSRYIRPGYTLIGSDNGNTLIAYDSEGEKAVIVAMNTSAKDETWKFDLRRFDSIGNAVEAYRTSGSLINGEGEHWAEVSNPAVVDVDSKSFITTLKANSITTYIISGVELDIEKADQNVAREKLLSEMQAEVLSGAGLDGLDLSGLEIPLTEGMVTGSAPWNNGTVNVPKTVIDGNFRTFFDGVSSGYIQVDLGEGNAAAIVAYGYAPRYDGKDSQYLGRCVGASLYGSNDGTNWTKLHTITEMPDPDVITPAYMNHFTSVDVMGKAFRYYKYAVDSNGNCNISEFRLYRMPENLELPEIPDTLEKWVLFCESKTDGRTYTEETGNAYTAALTNAKELSGSADVSAREDAQYALFETYLALKEVYNYTTFSGAAGDTIYDTNAEVIQAHGGQVQQITYEGETFWYWIGEDKTNDYRPCPGIHAYISKDLLNWEDKGCVLRTVDNWETFTTDEYFTSLYGELSEEDQRRVYGDLWTDDDSSASGCVIERPKMLYNEKDDQYVIWFHADGQTPDSSGGNYAKAKAGIAVSKSPFGPFALQGSYLLASDPSRRDHGFDTEGGHVRDMNLFKDDDGTAYVMYSSEGNEIMYIAKLNDSYTGLAKDTDEMILNEDFCISSTDSREAPAMFKYNDKYYLITSGCTGWAPNPAAYAMADSPLGPWTRMGDPCVGDTGGNTFRTQSTCVIPVDPATGKYIYMGDRWDNPDTGGKLRNSRYVWLPIEFKEDGGIEISSRSDWSLELFDEWTDKNVLNAKILAAERLKEEYYLAENWPEFKTALQEAKEVQKKQGVTDVERAQASADLTTAMNALKSVREYLQEEIDRISNGVLESAYTAETWAIYKQYLDAANALTNADLTLEEADAAIEDLDVAKSILEKKPSQDGNETNPDDNITKPGGNNPGNVTPDPDNNAGKKADQVISVNGSYTKTYGNKAFSLNAKLTAGDGALSYKSSNEKVASVSSAGKVTLKATGYAVITITAAATSKYNEKSVSVSLKVNPKKINISSVKPQSGQKLKVSWKKDTTVTGYEVQVCLNKKFKSGVKKATVKKAKTTSTTIKGLKKGKKYYVRVRAYKTVNINGKSTKLYSTWVVKTSKKVK